MVHVSFPYVVQKHELLMLSWSKGGWMCFGPFEIKTTIPAMKINKSLLVFTCYVSWKPHQAQCKPIQKIRFLGLPSDPSWCGESSKETQKNKGLSLGQWNSSSAMNCKKGPMLWTAVKCEWLSKKSQRWKTQRTHTSIRQRLTPPHSRFP